VGGRFTILGSGTGVPVAKRGPSGYLLEAGGERVLFDSGSGTLKRMAEAGVSPDTLDRVFYTHYHIDHFMDLPSLFFALKHPSLDRERVLQVYGPDGLRRLVSGLQDLFKPWLMPENVSIHLHEVGPGWCERLPCGEVSSALTQHQEGSLAYRISLPGEGVVVYSGDTGYSTEMVKLARDADVLVCECALEGTRDAPYHLNGEQAGRIAAEAGVGCLVLTHFYPEVDLTEVPELVKKRYQGKLVLAEDLLTFKIEDS